MNTLLKSILACGLLAAPAIVQADASVGFERERGRSAKAELPPYLQCVPYARELSGIQIFGDALTWWEQAAGRYERGRRPQVGAVMAFVPHRKMQLGHVAAVSKIIDSRTVLLDHSNWSPINGRRGQIERNVKAVDVSPNNDWSQVRVWYNPLQALGKTAWPVQGFIYGTKESVSQTRMAAAPRPVKPMSPEPSRAFANAFASLDIPAAKAPRRPIVREAARPTARPTARPRVAAATPQRAQPVQRRDAIDTAISLYD